MEGAPRHPVVEALVADVSTLLVLDTGATDHVLARRLVERLGLELHEGESGTDSTGGLVRSWSIGPLTVELGGATFRFSAVHAIDGPAVFERWGIGGVLSPQRLAPAVALDLDQGRLVHSQEPGALADWVASTVDGWAVVPMRSPGSGLVCVPVEVRANSFQSDGLGLVDTGAATTTVAVPRNRRHSGLPGGHEAGAYSAGGSWLEARRSVVASVTIAGNPIAVHEVHLQDSIPRPEGFSETDMPIALVGADALGDTVVMLTPDPVLYLRR